MSDFFRTHAPPGFAASSRSVLAGMVHDAEQTGDDVLLLQCYDELCRRGADTGGESLFMEHYRRLWRERAEG